MNVAHDEECTRTVAAEEGDDGPEDVEPVSVPRRSKNDGVKPIVE